jgi:hypothetical protein
MRHRRVTTTQSIHSIISTIPRNMKINPLRTIVVMKLVQELHASIDIEYCNKIEFHRGTQNDPAASRRSDFVIRGQSERTNSEPLLKKMNSGDFKTAGFRCIAYLYITCWDILSSEKSRLDFTTVRMHGSPTVG